jgi:hypothetical protein
MRSIRRFILVWSLVPIAGEIFPKTVAAQSPGAPAPEVAPEIKGIQQSLGGPIVERFATLRDTGNQSHSPAEEKAAAVRQQQAVEALRQAAMELDSAANRLERLELYRQADALREQAQRLRLDARDMSGKKHAESRAAALRPSDWNDTRPAAPMIVPTPAPTQSTSPEPGPDNPDNRQKTVPSLRPEPHPE